MQKTNFPFEVLIHDDASIDGTQDIVREFEEKYPQLIKPICQTENQYSKGIKASPTFQFPRAKGKYIALCEGDDYWTDPQKLQKQVTLLEKTSHYSLCFHNVLIDDTTGDYKGIKSYAEKNKLLGDYDKTFTIADTALGGLIPTCSVVMRNTSIMNDLPPFFQRTLTGDWLLWLLACGSKKMRYLGESMAVYRVHSGGMSYGIRRDPQSLFLDRAEILMEVDLLYKNELHDELSQSLISYFSRVPFNEATFPLFDRFKKNYPEKNPLILSQVAKNAYENIGKIKCAGSLPSKTICELKENITALFEWVNSDIEGFQTTDIPMICKFYHYISLSFSALYDFTKANEAVNCSLKTLKYEHCIEAGNDLKVQQIDLLVQLGRFETLKIFSGIWKKVMELLARTRKDYASKTLGAMRKL